jgi:hypothetical protein
MMDSDRKARSSGLFRLRAASGNDRSRRIIFSNYLQVSTDMDNVDANPIIPQATDPEQLKPLFKPYPSGFMEIYLVSDLVNSPRNETPECIKPMKV